MMIPRFEMEYHLRRSSQIGSIELTLRIPPEGQPLSLLDALKDDKQALGMLMLSLLI